jgi:hypothetical protein
MTHHKHGLCETRRSLIVHALGTLAGLAHAPLEKWCTFRSRAGPGGGGTSALLRVGLLIVIIYVFVLIQVFTGLPSASQAIQHNLTK